MNKNAAVMARPLFLCVFLILLTVLLVSGLMSQLNLLKPPFSLVALAASLFYFDKYFLELMIVLFFGVWLVNGGWFARILAYIFTSAFILSHMLQFIFIQRTGNFISRLAVDNINHVSLVINSKNITAAGITIAACVALPLFTETIFKQPVSKKTLNALLLLLSITGLLLFHDSRWLPDAVQEQRAAYFQANNMKHSPPMLALYIELFRSDGPEADLSFTRQEIQALQKFGFHYNPKSNYPLIRNSTPGKSVLFGSKTSNQTRPNIIVFFSEGISARATSVYSSEFHDLTPHLLDFSKESMVVQNYFNHTAATYRGLLGQLCSLYPKYGGLGGWHTNYNSLPKTDYFSLAQVFKNNGYETVFLDPHFKDYAYIDEMMRRLDFDRVLTAEDLLKNYLRNSPLALGTDLTIQTQPKEALSDGQIYTALIEFLKKRAEKTQSQPLFLAMYNLGTHAWTETGTDGKKYRDGANYSLNAIHSLDAAFGKFWEYYKTSSYARDTIVIFTSDHAHFQDESYVSAVLKSGQTGYQRIFIDRIPLIIHDPFKNLPKTFDAHNATSIDFTPTLIHYLDLSNPRNAFLGNSLFSEERKVYDHYGISSIGDDQFLIDNDQINTLENSKAYRDSIMLVWKFIRRCQQLEAENKIWDQHGSA